MVPADVVALILRQDAVLLGRYSEAQFVGLCLATLLVALAAPMLAWGVSALEVLVRIGLVTIFSAAGFAIASLLSYVPAEPRYIETPVGEFPLARELGLAGKTRRRQPDRHFELMRRDRPPVPRSYPDPPPGFPEARVTLTTDAHGFRNPLLPAQCETVVVGDSFAEGSMVSDDEPWVRRVADGAGRCIYNAAVSGASPWEYVNNLVAFGLPLGPRRVIFSVYEGNDFKRNPRPRAPAGGEPTLGERWTELRSLAFKRSPIRARLKRWLLHTFGPVGADASVPPSVALDWMPLRLGPATSRHAYAFQPRRLLRLLWEEEAFLASREWTSNEEAFLELLRLSERFGFELVALYAPSAPHVLLPLAREQTPPAALHAFAAAAGKQLPPPQAFYDRVFRELDSQESVFLRFCRAHGITCLSTTAALRDAAKRGEQVYFTYDPHWTRLGHAVVADLVLRHLGALPPPGRRPAAAAGGPGVDSPR